MSRRHPAAWLAAALWLPGAVACAGPALELRYRELVQEQARAASPAPGDPEDPLAGAAQLERAALVRAVLERNPSLESARSAWRAALARFPQETSLDDPMFGAMWAPNSLGADAVRGGYRVDLRQAFPFPGKLSLRGEAALAEAEAASHDYGALRLRLAALASALSDAWYLAARALEINAEHLRLLGEFHRIALSRYEAGLTSAQDPLLAETEQAELLHREVELEAEQRIVAARINALLHRSPTLPLPPPPSRLSAAAHGFEAGTGAPPEALLERALAARPELRAAASRVRAREASVALARREFFPDFELQGVYDAIWQEPELRPGVGVTIELPLRIARRRAALDEARAELERARSEERRMADEVRFGVTSALARLHESEHLLALVGERLLPAARDRVVAARAAFESGEASFLELIEAERALRSAELEQHRALADTGRSRAELERAVGDAAALEQGDRP